MSLRTNCCKTFLFVFVLLAIAILAMPAFAQNTCLQNEYNLAAGLSATSTAQSNQVTCTANDVRIAKVSNVRDPATGATLSSCVLGSHFDFIADFQVVTTATSTRSNIGMFIATNSTTQALTGACADNLIPPPTAPQANGLPAQFPCAASGAAHNIMCGTNYYDEFDPQSDKKGPTPDNCGDSSSQDNGGASGQQIITLLIQSYSCTPPAGSNQLVLPNCTSWQIPGGTIQCQAPTGQQSYNLAAIPGTKSKCNCDVISLPVIAQTPSVLVQKECTTTNTAGPATNNAGNPSAVPPVAPTQTPVSCDSGVEGSDTVTYHVEVTNQSNFGTVSLTSLTDSVYGNIGGSCPSAGCTALSTTCTVPQTIQPGNANAYTCSFTAKTTGDPANATVTNHVSANGTSQFATGNFGPVNSNDVTVTPTEAPSSATVTKSLNSLRAASITARFGIDVENTSSTTFDESETLTALSDSVFGAISPTPATGVTTSCFTSASNPNGVSLVPGAGYQCTFDVTIPLASLTSVKEYGTGTCDTQSHFCSAGQPNTTACSVNSDCDATCLGIHHQNAITATILGDEGAAAEVNPLTRNLLNTDVCLTSFTLSQ
jgi:hypothetical protein